jgi:hypothetical protein
MTRVCSRPGCSEPATVTFVFSPAQLTVWVGDLVDDPRSMGHDLCETHSGRLSVPAGWQLTDERTRRAPLVENAPTSPMLARAFRSAHAS